MVQSQSREGKTLLFNTVEPQNNGHIGDEHFVHCSEVVPSEEVDNIGAGGVHSREVVHFSESPLVQLYKQVEGNMQA